MLGIGARIWTGHCTLIMTGCGAHDISPRWYRQKQYEMLDASCLFIWLITAKDCIVCIHYKVFKFYTHIIIEILLTVIFNLET
jgi:hypothetical protein